jgi:tetratricopeptide (TPR) repeat protein
LALWLVATPMPASAAEDCYKGSGDAAIAGCTELIQDNPEDAVAYGRRGVLYAKKGDLDRAIADFTQAIALDPKLAAAYATRGNTYIDKGDLDRALVDLNKAVELDAKMAATYVFRARAYLGKGNNKAAIADLEKAVSLGPDDASKQEAQALLTRLKADTTSSDEDAETAATQPPAPAPAEQTTADPNADADFKTCASFGDDKLEACNRAIASGKFSGKNLSTLYNNRSTANFLKRDDQAAFADIQKAVELNPDNPAALSSRGMMYTDKGEYDLAIKDLDKAIALNPHPMAFGNRGDVYVKKGEYDRAIADFSEAIRRAPPAQARMQMNYYWDRANAFRLKGDREHAKADFDKALSLGPSADTRKLIEADLGKLDTGAPTQASPQPSASPASESAESEAATMQLPLPNGVYRLTGINPDGGSYVGIVALTDAGGEVKITAWNAKKTMRGTGNYAGDSFVLKWNDGIRVTFNPSDDGALEGESADGMVVERLELFAVAAPKDVTLAEGAYRVAGRVEVDASADAAGILEQQTYDGTAEITKSKKGYRVSWNTPPTSYKGTGTLTDNILTVTWGSNTPSVFALTQDGSLLGLWTSGVGEEIMVPENPDLNEQPSAELPKGSHPNRKDCKRYLAMEVALPACERAIESGQYSGRQLAMLYYNRGAMYAFNKKDQEAIADFSKAIEIDPDLALAYLSRARAYEKTESVGPAIDDYNKVVELKPNDMPSKNALERIGPDIRKMRMQ